MSITVIVEFSPKPECTDTLKQFLAETLPDTRAYNAVPTWMSTTILIAMATLW